MDDKPVAERSITHTPEKSPNKHYKVNNVFVNIADDPKYTNKRKKLFLSLTERMSQTFGLVSLFNGISTFLVYLMLKLSLKKNNRDTN